MLEYSSQIGAGCGQCGVDFTRDACANIIEKKNCCLITVMDRESGVVNCQ